MNSRKKIAVLVAGAAIVGGTALTAAPAAVAASGDAGYLHAFSEVRSGPNNVYALQYVTSYDAWIPFQCWTDTNDFSGGPTHRWFKFNQVNSWTRADNVSSQPSLPHC